MRTGVVFLKKFGFCLYHAGHGEKLRRDADIEST